MTNPDIILASSNVIEPKKVTWRILWKRYQMTAGFKSQSDWMDAQLKRAGFNPKEWQKTGELPSEMICRFARDSKKTIDQFLLEVMK